MIVDLATHCRMMNGDMHPYQDEFYNMLETQPKFTTLTTKHTRKGLMYFALGPNKSSWVYQCGEWVELTV